ncbi:AlkA N-terminal domain-containing protein [Antribacter gilvus]|uniref:AlkA N-terminal domain-containing protein n=1 Tax=Antribacter gilvus TaxID=2304675 RepID=UPI000F77D564|nr:AlkA N-terminal domain-containing protein [Antribacter gilvus]
MDTHFSERYRAIAARDRRFDGQFFTAVRSTGIYCRPSCPARTPKAENVTFYLTSAAAHEAGFRACKRCLPEAAPGTPEWNLRRDLAGRVMRLVADGVVDREGVDGLAARLGYSTRHIHRLVAGELGAGPLALARAQRAQTARALLVGTTLPVADVAFAAGFGSIRQFNDTVTEVFATTPTELRARARRARASGVGPSSQGRSINGPTPRQATDAAPQPVRIDLTLPFREPFDARGVLEFLAVRAIDGVESADLSGPDLRYARTVTLPNGPGAFEVTYRPGAAAGRARPRIDLHLEVAHLADVPVAVARVRRLLDLDADPEAVDAALASDPVLAPLVAATPGIRVPGAVDPHELVVRAIVGQQISVAAARTHLTRLASAAGTPYPAGIAGLTTLFPAPHQVADAAPAHLRLPARNVRTVVDTAQALADGELGVSVGDDVEELRAALVARPGIGPWTAGYVALRVLGDPDVLLDRDVALLAGARSLGLLEPPDRAGTAGRAQEFRALQARGAAWAPWRSYAAMHLWRAATPSTSAAPTTTRSLP